MSAKNNEKNYARKTKHISGSKVSLLSKDEQIIKRKERIG